ncbi:hypothetical protein SAMN04488056_10328 [Cohaesibacter marisflavi]|uniref:Uncharacterized protein n=1 Tax=Cohaesibacter marisflavi TaxID=655353 RepID=A0A1I5E4I7_9HYPH|nr:hypothetical protein SAMN04488056_10328 [Cohaesibacter marisflavi]
MIGERPFRQETSHREYVLCKSLSDACERWLSCPEPRIEKAHRSILLMSYVQSGLGNRVLLALVFPSANMCGRFVDAVAMAVVEGRAKC